MSRPWLSVVIPTHDRRDLLERCLASLNEQTLASDAFEVVVVVDGSTDGTTAMLERFGSTYSLRWLEGTQRGLSAARNSGNRLATAPIIVCLDDDMIAAPSLLDAHLHAHSSRPGRLVQGALALHESVQRTPYRRYEERLRSDFHRAKSQPDATLDSEDVSGGNLSIARDVLDQVGGFDERLRRNTDGELAYRLHEHGVAIAYAPEALAWMTHSNDFDEQLRASEVYGRSYVKTQERHPRSRWRTSPFVLDAGSTLRNLARRYVYARPNSSSDATSNDVTSSDVTSSDATWLARLVQAAIPVSTALGLTPVTEALFRLALDQAFFRGVRNEAGPAFDSFLPRRIPILCYHQVSDDHRPQFRRYVLPPERFARQMRWLVDNGYQAVDLDTLHAYLDRGAPLPEKPVVITFDDGYAALQQHATPLLAELGLQHTHFINTGKLGGTTDWVEDAPDLPLLDAEAIADMARRFGAVVDFQAHGRNHLSMEGVEWDLGLAEIRHCVEVLEPLTGRAVRFVAYPYGDYDRATPAAMDHLGIAASFTVDRGTCGPGQNLQLLPRVEVFTTDTHLDFVSKVERGWGPIASLRIHVGRALERLLHLPRALGWQRG